MQGTTASADFRRTKTRSFFSADDPYLDEAAEEFQELLSHTVKAYTEHA